MGSNKRQTLTSIIEKNKHYILYLFFGVLTTAVDYTVSFVLYGRINHHIANVTAWIAAVAFAFFTNRKYVFKSNVSGIGSVMKEFFAFALGRVASLGVQELLFFVFVDVLDIKDYYVKIPASVAVVIINYFLSVLIFRSKDKEKINKSEAQNETEL